MKTFVILCVLIAVMSDQSKAQRGNVISNPDSFYSNAAAGGYRPNRPGHPNIVNNPDPFFSNPGGNVITNPDPGFAQGGHGGNFITNPDPGFGQGGHGVQVVDPGFGPGNVQVVDPGFGPGNGVHVVENSRPNRPWYRPNRPGTVPDSYLRGGK